MSVIQTTPEHSPADLVRCTRCAVTLPPGATFCGRCGERVQKTADSVSSPINADITERYLITAAESRWPPHGTLIQAIDQQQQRPVVIRDISLGDLDEETRSKAIECAQQEYDLLRSRTFLAILPVIDLRYFQNHLYTIAGWPAHKGQNRATQPVTQPITLFDLLEDDRDLPEEEIILTWFYRLSRGIDQLHQLQIFIGNLDPFSIMLNGTDYDSTPAIALAWLPATLHAMLFGNSVTTDPGYRYSAPEVQQGHVDARSDVYSLGALLYLLLTGVGPDDTRQRERQSMPSPRERNSTVSSGIDEVVMKALAWKPEERYQSCGELAEVLLGLCSSTKPVKPVQTSATGKRRPYNTPTEQELQQYQTVPAPQKDDESDAITVRVSPLQAQMAQQHMQQLASGTADAANDAEKTLRIPHSSIAQDLPPTLSPVSDTFDTEQPPGIGRSLTTRAHITQDLSKSVDHLVSSFKRRVTGVLPALPRVLPKSLLPVEGATTSRRQIVPTRHDDEQAFLKKLQRFILGEQQHSTNAAALIESPLRVRPNQHYLLRIHLMGRNVPARPVGAKENDPLMGLSGMKQGEHIHIEVRSALFQNYAYIIQQTNVIIPQHGYAAEVTIPMQAISEGPSGRRERLHIFFLDEQGHPLYEKPFVIEILISHLVQAGREGHHVLTIPI